MNQNNRMSGDKPIQVLPFSAVDAIAESMEDGLPAEKDEAFEWFARRYEGVVRGTVNCLAESGFVVKYSGPHPKSIEASVVWDGIEFTKGDRIPFLVTIVITSMTSGCRDSVLRRLSTFLSICADRKLASYPLRIAFEWVKGDALVIIAFGNCVVGCDDAETRSKVIACLERADCGWRRA